MAADNFDRLKNIFFVIFNAYDILDSRDEILEIWNE